MSRYFIFASKSAADAVNDRVSAARQPNWCDGVTTRAMSVMGHADGRAALVGDDRHAPHLTDAERANEATRDSMEADGWFPEDVS